MDDDLLTALQARAVKFLRAGAVEPDGEDGAEAETGGTLSLSAPEAGCLIALIGHELRRREQQAQSNSGTPRDELGRIVRSVWLNWAAEQPDVADHPSWTKPYDGPDGIEERDREVDRRIGETLFAAARMGYQRVSEARDAIGTVYRDRNLALVLAASLLGSLGIRVTLADDPAPKAGWRHVLLVELNVGVVAWRIHDHDMAMFSKVPKSGSVDGLPTRQVMADRIFVAVEEFEAMARSARAARTRG